MKVPTNGTKVRQLRDYKGWSQQQLADKAHTSDRTIQRIEHGEGARRDIVGSVAATLGVAVEDVLATVDESGSSVEVAAGGWPVRLNRITSGRALLDLLIWASSLRFEHDLDPGRDLSYSMTSFIEMCGDIAEDEIHMEQIDTSFAVVVATMEIDRIGSLNASLGSLSSQGAYVYAGAYTRKYTCLDPFGIDAAEDAERVQRGEEPKNHRFIELMLLIHILGRDVPRITVNVERKAEDELLDKEAYDEKHSYPVSWKLTRASGPLGKKRDDDEDTI